MPPSTSAIWWILGGIGAVLLARRAMTVDPTLAGLDPRLAVIVPEFLATCAQAGVPIRILEGERTPERQALLYAQGRTQPGEIVTWTLRSKHIGPTPLAGDGQAIDVDLVNTYPNTRDGRAQRDFDRDVVGIIGEDLGLLWGGRWSPPDKFHFELREG